MTEHLRPTPRTVLDDYSLRGPLDGRLGGRTARNAEPVDPTIRTTHYPPRIVECGLLIGT